MDILKLGAHTSTAGGAHNALFEGKSIGATTIQLFTSNQKQWKGKKRSPEELMQWREAVDKTGIHEVMSHDSYLINLGSPDPEARAKSLQAFREEIVRCLELQVTYLNFHPGAALKESVEACLENIAESVTACADLVSDSSLRLLIEATAGQGSSVGHSFEQLGWLIEKLKGKIPIGICIDTCHIFAAGYDLRTSEAFENTFQMFDKIIGIEHLYALHLNDSKASLGSRVDRHANLGEGLIGMECFERIVQDSRLKKLPMYLETPKGPLRWKEEIAHLRQAGHVH